MPKVSIIIPVYNVEKYLRQCLDSVINQTLKDIEIICINDGSTDNSLNIINEFASNDARIIIIDQENKGVAKARNIAIDMAGGQFVCFLDSDDYYPAQDILETLYNKAVENNVKICGGELAIFENNNPELMQNFGKNYSGFLFKNDGFVKYYDYQFDCGFYRFLYNRDFLISNNLYFPAYRRFQDPPFLVNAMFTAKEFYAVNKIVYAYRKKHKVMIWDKVKIVDALSGINDNFAYARKYKLQKLTTYTYARLQNHLKLFNDKKFLSKNLILFKIFLQEPYVRKMYLKSFFQSVFSIKNKNHHKIITILGIKIKYKIEKGRQKHHGIH